MLAAGTGWTPLYLSTLAGMSTCLGALVVYCHPIDDGDNANDEEREILASEEGSTTSRKIGKRKVSPSTMAFSLALAGSVMVTVSVVSIGPECLAASSMQQNSQISKNLDEDNSFFIFGITLMPIFSWEFLHRLLSFVAGWFIYFLMSKYAFPEPEEILSNHFEDERRMRISTLPSDCSDKYSDDELDGNINNEYIRTAESPLNKNIDSSNNLNVSLQRRGKEVEVTMSTIKGESKRKGHSSNPFTTCLSSLLVFIRGSDLLTSEARRANRVAMLLFFSLLLHNFPEGLAVAASALESDKLGLTVTIGIMIHNIPEGIAIAIPCLKARPDSPFLCFLLASVSGLAEPAGAFVSLIFLRGVEHRQQVEGGNVEGSEIGGAGSLENVLAFVAGIMVTVSFLELFPEAKRHTEKCGMKAYYAGLAVGFIVMMATEFGMSL
jgi:ZIP family zinc transporter